MTQNEHVKAQLTPAGKFTLLLILCEILVFAVAVFFGQPEYGLSGCISIAILLIAMRATWKLHENRWYWIAVTVSAALQIPFDFFVPWSNQAYRGTALAAFGFLDFFIVWGGIKITERAIDRA